MSQAETRSLLPDWHQRLVRWKVDRTDGGVVLGPMTFGEACSELGRQANHRRSNDGASRVESLSASTTDKGGTPQPQLDLSFTQSGSKPHWRSSILPIYVAGGTMKPGFSNW